MNARESFQIVRDKNITNETLSTKQKHPLASVIESHNMYATINTATETTVPIPFLGKLNLTVINLASPPGTGNITIECPFIDETTTIASSLNSSISRTTTYGKVQISDAEIQPIVDDNPNKRDFIISPDSTRILFAADVDGDNIDELNIAPLFGGSITRVGPIPSGGDDYLQFGFTPDGTKALFIKGGTDYELYSISLLECDATPIKINGTLVTNGDVKSYLVAPDNVTVVYCADADTVDVDQLYVVPIDGSADPITLSTINTNEVFEIVGNNVIYREKFGNGNLYKVSITGGTEIQLNADFSPGGGVQDFKVSPDGTTVVYIVDNGSTNDLYSVPINDPENATKINAANTNLYTTSLRETYAITNDSGTVAYLATVDGTFIYELYTVPIGGGTSIKISGDLTSTEDITDLVISPDDQYVVFRGDLDTNSVFEAYSIPLVGGDIVKISKTMVSGGDVNSSASLFVTPDSTTVIYRADADTNGIIEIYSVPIRGGTSTTLNVTLPGDVSDETTISPDGRAVVYTGDTSGFSEPFELFSTQLAAGPETSGKFTISSVSPGTYEIYIYNP